jgi:hypothetical protein
MADSIATMIFDYLYYSTAGAALEAAGDGSRTYFALLTPVAQPAIFSARRPYKGDEAHLGAGRSG